MKKLTITVEAEDRNQMLRGMLEVAKQLKGGGREWAEFKAAGRRWKFKTEEKPDN